MRQIFSSQRVETAEGVAKLLRDAGIEVRISNGRSYKSKRSGQFSYTEQASTQNLPTVWVVRADEQTRAREILREARLLDTTRRDLPNAQYSFSATTAGTDSASGPRWAWRIRIALLLVIAVIAVFVVMRHRPSPTTTPPVQPAATTTDQPSAAPDEVRVRIQPAQ